MANVSYLKLSRYNIYVFRRRVPNSLLKFFNTNELRISTKTRDKRIAIHIARNIANESDLLFERLKNNKNMANEEDIAALNALLERWRTTTYFKARIEDEYNLRLESIVDGSRQIKELESIHKQALNQQEGGYKLALSAVAALVSGQPDIRSGALEIDFKLSELVEDFLSPKSIARRNDKPATVRKDSDALKRFIAIVGDKKISELTQRDAVDFADIIPTFGLVNKTRAVGTISGYFGSVSKFSGWITTFHSEIGHKQLDFSKLRYKKTSKDSDDREMFSDADVMAIFTHPKFIELQNSNDPKFWLISVAAYTGMRLEEITQLNPNGDIYKDESDIWVFDINEKNTKSLKNNSSPRVVPIHSKLLELGFLAYIKSLQARNAMRLFPETKIRDGRTGKNIGKNTNRFIQKTVGIEGKSNHSFRHTLATKLMRTGIDISIAAQILGHAHGGVTYGTYGKGHSIKVIKEALEVVNFEEKNE